MTKAATQWAIGLVLSLVFAFAALGADETAPVQKPDVKVGDRWRYQVKEYQSNVPIVSQIDSRISFLGPNAIVMVETGKDGQETDSQLDAEWGVLTVGYLGLVFDPPMRLFKFPLQVGMEYPFAYGLAAARGSPARTKAEGSAKVLGWEDVTVPAGKFRALKVEARAAFQRLDIRANGWQRFVLWYAPEVKRFVRSTVESGGRGPSQLDLVRETELMEFKLQ